MSTYLLSFFLGLYGSHLVFTFPNITILLGFITSFQLYIALSRSVRTVTFKDGEIPFRYLLYSTKSFDIH
jgi:hypothetical protein